MGLLNTYYQRYIHNTVKTKMSAKPAKKPSHPTYRVMIAAAIKQLKQTKGSSRQAISNAIAKTHNIAPGASHNLHLRNTLKKMMEAGELSQTKGNGVSGSFKLANKEAPKKKQAAKKPAAKKAVTKKSPAKKKPATKNLAKKPASPKKKAAPKK